jgi:hypothetical protein
MAYTYRRRALVSCGALALTAVQLTPVVDATTTAAYADARPCDIFAAGGTPCVAAHSLVRALFAAFDGPLYRVKRTLDNETATIGVATTGGFADASVQDRLCNGSDCIVDMIMDQTANKNHLLVGVGGDVATGPGGRAAPDFGVNASRLPITLQGHRVYGAYVEPGMGYRTNNTDNKPCPGVATGNEPETVYMVASGTHFNGACCFDYVGLAFYRYGFILGSRAGPVVFFVKPTTLLPSDADAMAGKR